MIVAAARSGARTAYVTRLGDDEYGRLFLELWRAEGVDASGVGIDPLAPTGAYYVSHGPQGHAFRYERAGSAASRLRPQDLPRELIAGADFVHASGISLAISPSAAESVQSAYAAARAAGAMISFDANLRPALWPIERARPMIAAAAGAADYFFLSIEEAMPLSGLRSDADGESVLDWAHRLGARTVFLKLGAAGAWVSNGGRRVTWESVPGKNYQVYSAPEITFALEPISAPITAFQTTTSYTNNAPLSAREFYRVRVLQ
jgi:2-dehydro-3-deoxygluconokinase